MSTNESGIECKICGDYNCEYVCTECYNKETHELQAKIKSLKTLDNSRVITINELKKYYENKIAEARSQAFRDAMAVYEPYIKLLIEEINELIPLAMVHGWKSSRYDAGIKCRKDIANLSGQLRGEGK
jgi:ATP-dependent protease Clp ATPase subunit